MFLFFVLDIIRHCLACWNCFMCAIMWYFLVVSVDLMWSGPSKNCQKQSMEMANLHLILFLRSRSFWKVKRWVHIHVSVIHQPVILPRWVFSTFDTVFMFFILSRNYVLWLHAIRRLLDFLHGTPHISNWLHVCVYVAEKGSFCVGIIWGLKFVGKFTYNLIHKLCNIIVSF